MKTFSALFGLSILMLITVYSASTYAGSIIFRNKNNSMCTIDAPKVGAEPIQVNLTNSSNCKEPAIRSMEIVDLPSATQILLTDSPTCSKTLTDTGSNWYWFELKTTRKKTSLGITEIEYLGTFSPPSMVGPGVQMTGKESIRPSYDMRDTLSCVRITTSKEPVSANPATSSPSK